MGSSNARGIKLTNKKSFKITNNCIGGASILNLHEQFTMTNSQTHPNIRDELRKFDFFIIFQGMNTYSLSNWSNFTKDFETAMENLVKSGLPKERTIVIGPLPRGNNVQIWKHQMHSSSKLLNNLEKTGFNTINVFEEIPLNMRTPQQIFGYRDFKQQKYVHYGPYIINVINTLAVKKIMDLTKQNGGDRKENKTNNKRTTNQTWRN